MAGSDSGDVKRRREKAYETYRERPQQIQDWIKEHGKPMIRVNPFRINVTQASVKELIQAVEKELRAGVLPDRYALFNIYLYLQKYTIESAPIDEAGYDTPGFSLALSEVDVAWRHLQRNPQDAFRYLVSRYHLKTLANNFTLPDFPPVLHLEASFPCNLVCEMCYQAIPSLKQEIQEEPLKMMQWDLFTKVIDEAAARGCCAVVFAGRGEPTLNPRFSDMLKYCHEKGILDIKFNTNVMKLDEKMAREWLSMNAFLTIVFSVDAGDKEVFEKIRIGSDFDRIVANIKMFKQIRDEEFPDSPVRTRVNMVLFKSEQDPEQARALWAPLVDEFSARNANAEQAGSVYQTNADGTSPNVEPGVICRVLFTRLYIWSNGWINPCESDFKSKLKLGNAYHESIYDVWNRNKKMLDLRMNHLTSRKNSCYPCNGCSAK